MLNLYLIPFGILVFNEFLVAAYRENAARTMMKCLTVSVNTVNNAVEIDGWLYSPAGSCVDAISEDCEICIGSIRLSAMTHSISRTIA